MASAGDTSDDMVDQLVHQFSDPFAFYRELIQNGIDAGSARVEVVLKFEPGRAKGVATAAVQDWGEGMNRHVIETYLLTKFRSSKENDLTKIGKFGIGFMSVFSPAPELVMVETGRDGEYWRLLFQPDHTYELLRAPEPVEGTRVTLHKEMTAAEYVEFSARSREAIQRWCRHSEAEVAFCAGAEDGSAPGAPESLRQPLGLDAPFQVEYREEGTLIVAGPARAEPPECGLYNRGLTLLETREPFFPGVTFKIVSRYLAGDERRLNALAPGRRLFLPGEHLELAALNACPGASVSGHPAKGLWSTNSPGVVPGPIATPRTVTGAAQAFSTRVVRGAADEIRAVWPRISGW